MLLEDANNLLFCLLFVCPTSILLLLLLLLPAIVSTAAYPEHLAQHLYGILSCMQLNKTIQVLQVCRLKMAKAFFKISLSCSRCWIRLCKVIISSAAVFIVGVPLL